MRRVICIASLVALAACGGDNTSPQSSSVTGLWVGSSGGVSMTLTMTQTGSQVAATGQINSDGTAVALTGTGTFAPPTVSLNLSATGFQALNYTGNVSGTVITGTMNGSGFNNVNFILNRQ